MDALTEQAAHLLGEGYTAVSASLDPDGKLTVTAKPDKGEPRSVVIATGKDIAAAINLAIVKLKG